ncbi:MAG: hypothetical protein WAW11_02765 [Patescibacteria group bacterium]
MKQEINLIGCVAPFELNNFLDKIMRQTGERDPAKIVALINSGEIVLANIKTGWEYQDGICSFSVTSDGMGGAQWPQRLKNKGISVDDEVKKILLSDKFQPTSGVTTKIFIIKGRNIKSGGKYLVEAAEKRGLIEPSYGAELACLTREKFSNLQICLMEVGTIVFGVGELFFCLDIDKDYITAVKRYMDQDFSYTFEAE